MILYDTYDTYMSLTSMMLGGLLGAFLCRRKLTLVDLAGSEKVRDSGSVGVGSPSSLVPMVTSS